MRRFEYIGGGSEKFWEIDLAGASVTIHFGRMGTAGQTQVKDLGSDQAATAHVAKLIAEKVKKGYVEQGSPAPAPAAPDVKAPAVTPTGPDLDEDTWTVPAAWWRQAAPFRGRGPARPIPVDAGAVQTAAELRRETAAPLALVLDNPTSDPYLVRAAQRFEHESTPFGAAVLGAITIGSTDWQQSEGWPAITDAWVATHGAAFAAEAAALLAGVRVRNPGHHHGPRHDNAVVRASAGDLTTNAYEPLLARMRAILAGADDGDYAEAVVRLDEHRDGVLSVRLATSFLLPTEQRWVDDDIDALTRSKAGGTLVTMLLASVTTGAQAAAILSRTNAWRAGRPEMMYSLGAHVGPEVAPVLAALFDGNSDADAKKRVAAMLGEIPTDAALSLLLARLDQKYVAPVVVTAMERFPHRAMRLLAQAASGPGAPATAARALLRGHVISHAGLVPLVAGGLSGPAAEALEAAKPSGAQVAQAPVGHIPPILVTPPWTTRRGPRESVVVPGMTSQSPTVVRWKPGEREAWAETDTGYSWMLGRIADWDGVVRRAVSGHDWRQVAIFALAPEGLVRPHLSHAEPTHAYDVEPALRRILARFGEEAIPYVLRVVLAKPTTLAAVLLPFEGSEIAGRMADWYVRSKTIRAVALSWFDRHPTGAARDLVGPALGPAGKDRSNAEAALRLLNQRGHGQAIRDAAAELGPAAEAIDEMLALDPLELLPPRIPALPAWLDPAHLPQLLLRDRRSALPADGVGNLCTMLAMSKPGDTYAGVEIVRAAVDPLSAAEMAWGIFERWQSAGYPAKDGWVLDALAVLGDDDTVRRLAPLIRAWPGEGAHKRAVTGLDVLSAIGTDVALMHLHGIAEKAKFAGLRTAAKAKMDEVAEGLGLSAEQLADRLVPDFGLEADGTMRLDYGGRRFRVGFDEQLKPVVTDEDGSRRKLLPKPTSKDDPALAPAAYARFAGLKKDVKTVAADQIRRFERAMVNGRRWTAGEQRVLFVDHPLLRHLSRRLVWATFDGSGQPTGSFRVAEDQTLADPDDDELTLPGDTAVGIAHPLHLTETVGAWSDVFADYEILQPFPQLGREVLALTAQERSDCLLRRFAGATVYTGRILGLSHRGWQRGSPQDAGVSNVTYKLVPGGRAVVADLDPGIIAGDAMEWPEQTITGVWLNDGPADWGNAKGNLSFGVLDDITASEMLRDIEGLLS